MGERIRRIVVEDAAPSGSRLRPARRSREWSWLLLFPLLAALLLWEPLFTGKVLLPAEFLKALSPWGALFTDADRRALPQWNVLQWDAMAEFYPWRLHAAREMTAGRIPLWNPYVLCGTPFLANSQSAPLYPLHLLYYLPLGVPVALRLAWVAFLHLSLAGVFTFMLARQWGARPVAAAVAGAAFQLSGFGVAWLELPSFITVGCWIPLALLAIGNAVRLGSGRWAAGAGGVIGLMLLSGHLQIALYGLLACGMVWAWETVAVLHSAPDKPLAPLARSVGLGTAAVGLGLVLAAPQMLPSVELSRVSHRVAPPSEVGYAGYVALAMPVRNLVSLLAPDYYGHPNRNDFWGVSNYGAAEVMEYAGWVGSAAFAFAVIGLAWGGRISRRVWLLTALALLALLLAMGSPLCRIFYFDVPGFAQSGSPARVLVLFCLSQALLAAFGVEALARAAERRWSDLLLPLATGVALTLLLLIGLHTFSQNSLQTLGLLQPVQEIGLPAVIRAGTYGAIAGLLLVLVAWLFRTNPPEQRSAGIGGAALALVVGGLLYLGAPHITTAPASLAYPPTPLTDALSRLPGRVATMNRSWRIDRVSPALLPPNASLAYGWRDAQGYDSLYLGNYRRLANAVMAPEDASPPANGNIVFIKHVASPLYPLLAARYLVAPVPLTRAGLRPFAGFSSGPPFLYEDSNAFPEAFLASPENTGNSEATLSPAAPAELVRESAGRLAVTVDAPAPGTLVVTEGYAPGWRATVSTSGSAPTPTAVSQANIAFQGVPVPAGRSTVRLSYTPASFRVGLFLALLGVGILAAVLLSIPRTGGRNAE